jgi:hypothetical protein
VCSGGLLLFADHGWNVGTPTLAKYMMVIGTAFLFLIVIVQFFGLTVSAKDRND